MSIQYSVSDVRYALLREVAGALNESIFTTSIEINEFILESEVYSVKGTFSVVLFLSNEPKKNGSVEAKFDKNLKLISIKITGKK